MGVSMEYMRNKVSEAYESTNWANKVNNMPDRQVAAIYNNMLDRVYFKCNRKRRKPIKVYHQMSIFDFGVERV